MRHPAEATDSQGHGVAESLARLGGGANDTPPNARATFVDHGSSSMSASGTVAGSSGEAAGWDALMDSQSSMVIRTSLA